MGLHTFAIIYYRHINFVTCIKSFSCEAAMAKYMALWYRRYNIPYSAIIAIIQIGVHKYLHEFKCNLGNVA